LVALVDGRLRVHKVLSTPQDPALAVFAGLKTILDGTAPGAVTYGSTVATNALLEGKGARVAIVTNAGFEDLIEIGRQNRSDLYALAPSRPVPLVARAMRIGASERTYFDGTIAKALSAAELARLASRVKALGAEAVAVCLLHSYANPRSEDAIAGALAPLGVPLSISHRLLAEYREFERLSTTVINAYVAPRMVAHLGNLERGLGSARLRVMQSDGNAIGAGLARLEPVRTILSGPAAGVIGAARLVGAMGIDRFITFDMGGTSTDVSLFDRGAHIRTLSYPSGYAVRTPVVDIHTVGAGGGSIARIDAGGSLKVGPESAGANPGPACYGRGDKPTVTDADLVAGRIIAENFLGGRMNLDAARANRAIAALARNMKTSALEAARGVIRVVNANMERAIRVITVERGFDPRDFAMLAFGGAGPMHACELARSLGIRRVVMPRNPGLLCAWGALSAPLGREYSMTVRDSEPAYRNLLKRAHPMIARAQAELIAQGVDRKRIKCALRTDMRYRGQSYEIEVALTPSFIRDFHAAHLRTFGHCAPDAPVEAVNLRLRAHAAELIPAPERIARAHGKPRPIRQASVMLDRAPRAIPVYSRDDLGTGTRLRGPMIIVEMSATGYVAPEWSVRVDGFGNLHLEASR
jgi:N-methylhydantoinase A/oxoprolinase/acetone carboxylase beta subunit